MARKNNAARQRNAKGRLNRREKGTSRIPEPVNKRYETPLTALVVPDGHCTFRVRKARFETKAKAEAALRQAQKKREALGSGHVEKRVYKCPEGGCGGWHLTSHEEYDEGAAARRAALRASGVPSDHSRARQA